MTYETDDDLCTLRPSELEALVYKILKRVEKLEEKLGEVK